MKRFWKDAAAVTGPEGFGIELDGRPVMTPHRRPLVLPSQALADAVAGEWNAVGDEIDPRQMPLTGIANAAIDIVSPDPNAFAASLAAYAETDLLAYRAENPAHLVSAQVAVWDPILQWAQARYDVHFTIVAGIIHQPQPAETVGRLTEAVNAQSTFTLAALSPIVTIGGSLVTALALMEGAFTPDEAWQAIVFDELWQEAQWGADALATQAREARQQEFEAAARFLFLSRP